MNFDIYKSAIYKVNTASGSGSGFFIQDSKFLITNHHVVDGFKEVAVEDGSENRYLGKVVYINPKVDVAFVLIDGFEEQEHSSITINNQLEVKERDPLFVLGFPYGMPFSITEGIVSSPDQLVSGSKYVQTDAAVNPGNSGGPMLNAAGNLIALTTCKFNDADNMGFGIPYATIIKEIDAYKKSESPEQFALACHSCHTLTYSAVEYCKACGAKLDKTLFDDHVLDTVGEFVEGALKELNMNPVLARVGSNYWRFHQGSSLIRIFTFEGNYLFATSPLNELPQENPGSLYEYLLSDPIKPYKLGISENQVYIAYRVHLDDVFSDKQEQIKKELVGLAVKADEMDDYLVDNYKCSMSEYSKKSLKRTV